MPDFYTYQAGDPTSDIGPRTASILTFSGNTNDSFIKELTQNSLDASSSSLNTQTTKSVCKYCKGTGKCRECGKTFRKEFYKGNGSYENRNESRPGFVMCNDCRGRGHKQVKRSEGGWEPGGDCYVSSCVDGWTPCRECNSYGNGSNPGKCKDCKGTGYRN